MNTDTSFKEGLTQADAFLLLFFQEGLHFQGSFDHIVGQTFAFAQTTGTHVGITDGLNFFEVFVLAQDKVKAFEAFIQFLHQFFRC